MPDTTTDRNHLLTNLGATDFDVIVVGAGINGAGIARDAVMRGLRVLLLDKGDIGEGTTAWSTRLIHGGLRYLEHYEFSLVRESLRERELLFRNAPHLVKPLEFMVPIYAGNKRGRWLMRLGMLAYDALSFDKSVPSHRILGVDDTIRHVPGINRSGLRGAAVYYDGQVEFPERIVVENALSAAKHGTTILTYTRVDQLIIESGRVAGVQFTDLLADDGRLYTVRAPLTINVTGPWVDRLTRNLSSKRLIGGTKGSHIIVAPFPGAPDSAIYVENEADARPYFIVPWNGLYLIGTTDFRYDGDLDNVNAGDDEIDYLIRDTNRVIPGAGLTRERVRYTYSGVRSLPYVEEGAESAITRRHIVHDHAPEIDGLISIIGGKLTTYRNLAEQATDLALRKLGRNNPKCLTKTVPFPGANTDDFGRFSAEFRVRSELDRETADRLLRIYGTRSRQVLETARKDPELLEPIPVAPNTIKGEIPFAFQREKALTLTDVLMRRTMLGFNADNAIPAIEAVAKVAARMNDWDRARITREIDDYHAYLERFGSTAAKRAAGG
jgi:glycerol-3-phosphate dehydrogenase